MAVDKSKIAKAIKLAKKHNKAAEDNGWRDNDVTERTQLEFNALERTFTDEERALFKRVM